MNGHPPTFAPDFLNTLFVPPILFSGAASESETLFPMKNISLILNVILLAAVAHLYYLNLRKAKPADQVIMPKTENAGVRVAHVNADTLDANYEWLKKQKAGIEQRVKNAESTLGNKKESLMKDLEAFQVKYQGGTMTEADAKKQYDALMQRQQKLADDEARLGKALGDEQKKAFNDLYANVESQLKTLSSQIGYDYILSYSRGGPILLANDSLDITTQVLQLLNAQEMPK